MAQEKNSVVVFSAHSGDFVWRAGGAIAKSAARGDDVHVICLSFGERGESQGLWRQEGMTMDTVRRVRREEASSAAEILGASTDFLDLGDYPCPSTSQHSTLWSTCCVSTSRTPS
ncbi:PIG-L family deacetylase [Nesterenkonia pannonica]|uniref:PIG-L deacetylase family protein n=1 Tax=Nesterenkonia pannonica TaxID=1548602 RepID=UPI002164A3EA|nr:PIG-L family deacetylase [Nesterenkonia pannonica]